MNVSMALNQEKGLAVVKGCGCCIYCYIGATLNCHRVRGESEPAVGFETISISMPIAPERFEWGADQVFDFLKLTGLLGVIGMDGDFRLKFGEFIFTIFLQGLLQQVVENAETERKRMAEEGNREFDEAFGGGGNVFDRLDTEREC